MDKKRKFSKKALRDFELIDAAIEFNDQLRKSAYSFELIDNDQLRVFPIPRRDEILYFDYWQILILNLIR